MKDGGPLERARNAFERHAWNEAYGLYHEALTQAALEPSDMEAHADAAFWSGRPDECLGIRERAYALYMEHGDRQSAARLALEMARDNALKGVHTVAMGWFTRAERALEGEPRWPEHAKLEIARAMMQGSDTPAARALADRALELATQFHDRDSLAQAVMLQGMSLINDGKLKEGLALVDEATMAAVSGEVELFTTGWIYCNTISTCRDLGDLRRAGEWTEAAHRWCERSSVGGFPGVCRVHRAEIIALQGSLARAEQEARQATVELGKYNFKGNVADGWYEIGAIRLRMGDLPAAEDAFHQAHELGRAPEPGLSLLRLAEGKPAIAAAALQRQLAETHGRPARSRLLPAMVESAIAADDLATARTAADELATIAEALEGPTLRAASLTARGRVLLAEGRNDDALRELRRALQMWQQLEMPFEASTVRLLLASGLMKAGDTDAARLELQSARATYERIGAVRDARAVAIMLGEASMPIGSPRVRKTFMFSDIVNSTSLVAAIGDEAWQDLIRWHDDTLRAIVAAHSGEEIRHQGDGLVVSFDDEGRAIDCAIAIQRRLAEQRRTQGFAPNVRIGIHTTDATKRGLDYAGIGVHEAARIGSLAGAGEIVASSETLSARSRELALGDARAVELKGIPEPVEVRAVIWR
jgi:class 3 adenylate cyclase